MKILDMNTFEPLLYQLKYIFDSFFHTCPLYNNLFSCVQNFRRHALSYIVFVSVLLQPCWLSNIVHSGCHDADDFLSGNIVLRMTDEH